MSRNIKFNNRKCFPYSEQKWGRRIEIKKRATASTLHTKTGGGGGSVEWKEKKKVQWKPKRDFAKRKERM